MKLLFCGAASMCAALALAGCADEPVVVACATSTGTGTLSVSIAQPVGSVPDITIVDNAGATHTVTAGRDVSVAAGPFTVSTRRTRAGGAPDLVGHTYIGVVDSTVTCVKGGESVDVHVTYAADPASHIVWVTDGHSSQILGFAAALLASTSAVVPTVALMGFTNPSSPTFDLNGTLWVIDSGRVKGYRSATLITGGVVTPDIQLEGADIEGPGIPGPSALAFDAAGNLWVANQAGDYVASFDADDISVSGSPEASVTITNAALAAPGALAFDADGNLWIGFEGGVMSYNASRLLADDSGAPDSILEGQTPGPVIGGLGRGDSLAFDAANNLWVAHFTGSIIARYTEAERGTANPITPTVQIETGVDVLLETIAFDEAGGLWFAGREHEIGRIAPSDLGASGTATVGTLLTVAAMGYADGIALNPPPAFTPIAF